MGVILSYWLGSEGRPPPFLHLRMSGGAGKGGAWPGSSGSTTMCRIGLDGLGAALAASFSRSLPVIQSAGHPITL